MPESPLLGLSQRLPPANIQAEQALLGAILANNKAYHYVSSYLTAEHFADPINGRIYQAMMRRIDGGGAVDAILLKTEFEHSGLLAEVGGTVYLAQLLASMVGIILAGDYGAAIFDAWVRRQSVDIGETIVNNAFGADPELDGEQVVRKGLDELTLLSQAFRGRRGHSFAEAIDAVLDAAQAAYKGDGRKPILTGLPALDACWGGLWPGFDVIGARSGHGKTAFGMQIAEHVAATLPEGRHVQAYSLEMPTDDLVMRMYQSRSGVSVDSMRLGKIGSVAATLLAARQEMLGLPLDIVDLPSMSVREIRLRAKADKKRLNTALIVIDHLHRIADPANMQRSIRLECVRYNAAALKDLSAELDIPIVVLAQLSADVERRPDHRPRVSDIEYLPERECDNICLLWRPELYVGVAPADEDFKSAETAQAAKEAFYKKQNHWKGKAEAIMAKRRFGAVTNITLGFDEVSLRFNDLELGS